MWRTMRTCGRAMSDKGPDMSAGAWLGALALLGLFLGALLIGGLL